MTRIAPRTFKNFQDGTEETREIDLDDPEALFPAGSVFMCESSHVSAIAVNSIFFGSKIYAEDLAPLQTGMNVVHAALLPPCQCGAKLYRRHRNVFQFHIQGKGWLPRTPWEPSDD